MLPINSDGKEDEKTLIKQNIKKLAKSRLFWIILLVVSINTMIGVLIMETKEKTDVTNYVLTNTGDSMVVNGDIYYIVNEWNIVGYTEYQIAETKEAYLECLKSAVNYNIVFYDYNDYDGNGHCEMFALVGEKDADSQNIYGELWYIDRRGTKKIEYDKRIYWTNPASYRIMGQCFLTLEQFYETGSVTYLWSVRNGEPYQPNISGRANGFGVNEYDEIELTFSRYDGGEVDNMMVGHTWKNYYFYYDGENFKEYGGRNITREELLKINGTDDIVNKIEENGYIIDSIYCRKNNICNINYSKKIQDSKSYENVTFRFNEYLEVVGNSTGEIYNSGIYEAASLPEFATYPRAKGL